MQIEKKIREKVLGLSENREKNVCPSENREAVLGPSENREKVLGNEIANREKTSPKGFSASKREMGIVWILD